MPNTAWLLWIFYFILNHKRMTTTSQFINWQPDESQARVIEINGGGYHLVLAPPGCGKTQILTERLRQAHQRGIDYADMLCLTFTNRAARGMRERINHYIEGDDLAKLYVGNIHRFCSKFLFEQGLIAGETSVIDDDDALSILARFQNEEEDQIKSNFERRREYAEIIHTAHLLFQIEHGHPRHLRLHPDCLSRNDIHALRRISEIEHTSFDRTFLLRLYEHATDYMDLIHGTDYDLALQRLAENLLRKLRYARSYATYCQQNHLIDFEDLLLLTYEAITHGTINHKYAWIQVDEVQDLNAMQVAIIDGFTDPCVARGEGTVMFLGDGQQAIFSFMGAKNDTLEMLHQRCADHIYHLNINHRAPAALLQMTNQYAATELKVSPALLPTTSEDSQAKPTKMQLVEAENINAEYRQVATLAQTITQTNQDNTTAIIVNSNFDADKVGEALGEVGAAFFQISGTDIFTSTEVKTMLAHLNILASETNFMAWARIIYGLGIYSAPASARELVRKMLNLAILPSDLLAYDGGMTYVQDAAKAVDEGEVVVFDTETTGLNVFEDDIVQIAAVKLRGGVMVPGSEFVVHITTTRPIPAMLGDTPNPIFEQRRHEQLIAPDEALSRFIRYVGSSRLVGHNVGYDYLILKHNLHRHLPQSAWDILAPCIDTLKLLRLFFPSLSSYRLDAFRQRHLFGLSEDNAHLADVDVEDTCRVLQHLLVKCREAIPAQREWLERKSVQQIMERLQRLYGPLYRQACEQLHQRPTEPTAEPAMVTQMRAILKAMKQTGITPVKEHKIEYVLRYLATEIIDAPTTTSLTEQLQRHLMEANTLKEADLCGSNVLNERIFVSTIHKAKGLEFDNVIIFDVTDNRYPGYYNRTDCELLDEDRRKLYVALTRAKQRIFVAWSRNRVNYRGESWPQHLSPFLACVLRFFDSLSV